MGADVFDKLDLRAPRDSPFRPSVQDYTRGLPYDTYTTRVRPAVHYKGKSDLRNIGIDAILHAFCKHGDHNHKLEILDAGTKTYSEIVQLIESVFDVDPAILGVMRIDCAADVAEIPVSWFQQHSRVDYKRLGCEHGEGKYREISRGEVETISAGQRPNVVRIYNKIAEWRVQYRRLLAAGKKTGNTPGTFEAVFGYAPDAMLTRVERQCGGNRIPEQIDTFAKLPNAIDYNPFSSIRFINSGGKRLPQPEQCSGVEYYTGIGLNSEWRRQGMQNFRKCLNMITHGNAARVMKRYAAFFPDDSDVEFTAEHLFKIYRESLQKQLAA